MEAVRYNYIVIEGNIGAGKTTLASMIAKDYNAKLILERFADILSFPNSTTIRHGTRFLSSFLSLQTGTAS